MHCDASVPQALTMLLMLAETLRSVTTTSGEQTGDPLMGLPPSCGRVEYVGTPIGWSAQRQSQGLFAEPVELGPCGANDGGWRCAVSKHVAQTYNESRQVMSIDADDVAALRAFEGTYRNREPVLIRSTKNGHAWLGPKGRKARTKRQKFGRDAFVRNAGSQQAKAGLSHDIVIKSEGYVRYTVAEYISEFMAPDSRQDTFKGEPFYLFQRARQETGEAVEWVGSLSSLLVPPEGLRFFGEKIDLHKNAVIWLIGPPRSGTAFHSHNEAWTALAHGRKRWLFYPPELSPPAGGNGPNIYPTYTITDWLDQVLPILPLEKRPIEVIQNAGDLIYVPDGWSHAVVNIDDTVALSFQRSKPVEGGKYEQLAELITGRAGGGTLFDSLLAMRLKAVRLQPCRNDLRYLVAESLMLEGQHAKAAQQYAEVLILDPLAAPAAVGLARTLIETGNHTGAVDVLQQMISRAPANRQLRGMYEKILGDAQMDMDQVYMQGALRHPEAYRRAKFNAYELVPELQRIAQLQEA